MVGMLEVDVLQAERIIPAITVCKIISVPIEQEGVLQGIIIVLASQCSAIAIMPSTSEAVVFYLCTERQEIPQVFFK